jgi:hypothetical protein
VTEGDVQFVQIMASWAAVAPTVVGLVRWDERRLDERARARGWPAVSRDAAFLMLWMMGFFFALLLAFLLVHFVRTRTSAEDIRRGDLRGLSRGIGLALLSFLVIEAINVAAQVGAAAAVGAPIDFS